MPQKILTDDAWTDALTRVVEEGRRRHKEVVLHTHFNHPREITAITKAAMDKLCERGITVRNQSVLQRNVNDSIETMTMLIRRLGYVNVHPYYIYMHDLVKGVEDLRTTLDTGLRIEKDIRGGTAGFNIDTGWFEHPWPERFVRPNRVSLEWRTIDPSGHVGWSEQHGVGGQRQRQRGYAFRDRHRRSEQRRFL